MKIYNINKKGIVKYLRKFTKTYYGKVIFVLSYSLPLIFLISYFICELKNQNYILKLVFIYISLISFIIGSIIFYKELKEFINKEN